MHETPVKIRILPGPPTGDDLSLQEERACVFPSLDPPTQEGRSISALKAVEFYKIVSWAKLNSSTELDVHRAALHLKERRIGVLSVSNKTCESPK